MAEGQVLSDQTALDKEALQLSAYLIELSFGRVA